MANVSTTIVLTIINIILPSTQIQVLILEQEINVTITLMIKLM